MRLNEPDSVADMTKLTKMGFFANSHGKMG